MRVKIDFDGFEQRVRALPAPPGNYQGLAANADAVFFLRGTPGGGPQSLRMFSFKDRKEDAVVDGIAGYDLSADGKKIIYRQRDDYSIVDARPGQKPGDGKLDLEKLTLRIQPREEWRQEYVDAWRIFRDWFYDPNLHGVAWLGIRDRYAQMLPYMSNRSDLDYLLGEIGAEISVGHAYVQPGNAPAPKRVEGALLGAEIVADPSGYFRVDHIFPGENWHASFRSPLTEPGVHVERGDYILAVDGQTTKGVDNFYRLLEGKADRVLTLLVNGKPSHPGGPRGEGPARRQRAEPPLPRLGADQPRQGRQALGRPHRLHPPAGHRRRRQPRAVQVLLSARQQGRPDLRRPLQRRGLHPRPDDRADLPAAAELLRRPRRASPIQTPQFANNGPKVTLINGQAGSGGDAFPYYFREMKLGPLIGTRTWGGLAGLSGNPPLVDGGTLTVPTFRILTTEGKWAVENEGVSPDIEVIDAPDALARGEDPSLERGVKYLLDQLQKNPPKKVVVPPPPVGGAPH